MVSDFDGSKINTTDWKGSRMKAKNCYLKDDVVNDAIFRPDLITEARDRGVPVITVLREFFASATFTKLELGRFATRVSATGLLIEGALILLRTLEISEDVAPTLNFLPDYFNASPSDPTYSGISWMIDSILGWKLGTIMPQSRGYLARF